MSEVQDHSALKWIKAELDASLEMARHALEAYVDESAPEEELDRCITHIHQVRGTLQLMQLYGAAMLAEEMEEVAKALRHHGEQKRRESAEVLMIGLAQLPEYLEKIESGASDNPLLLMPLMNELRAVRDVSLLSELTLFAPGLDQKLMAADGSQQANPDLPLIARKLRFQYHKALLDWYRGQDPDGGLQRIANIFKELKESAWTDQVQRLFQIGQAVVNALHEGSLDSGIATKLLVGKLDRQIKRIIDEGELEVAERPASDLLKNLLYYTATTDSQDSVVVQIKQAFNLEQGAVSPSTLAGEQSDLHAPGRDLLESLRAAIGADLTAIKDQLDLFIRSKSRDIERLKAQQEPLKKLADTLGMVGQGELRSRLMRQVDKITEIVATDSYPDDQDLLAIAGDILFIESSLNNLSIVRRYAEQSPDDQQRSTLPAGEFERLVDSVMHEAGIDMARNKEAIIHYIETPGNKALLENVPARFNGIAGAFSVLGLHDAAKMMGRLNHYVTESLLGNSAVPDTTELDALADAVTGIEYYMEAVTEGRGIHPEILDVTRDALARLNVPESVELETAEPPVEFAPDREAAAEAEQAVEPEAPEQKAVSEDSAPVHTPSADKPALEDIDPEILEIFIEEAEEELAAIQEYLPRWFDNRDDQDALAIFRRSFHTLKGSGRLVGAKVIGEFAWSIENLLNRIIDQTVEVTLEIIDLLKESVKVLPDLIQSEKQGTPLTVDVQPLMHRAEALAKPGHSAEQAVSYDESADVDDQSVSIDQLDQLEEEIADEAAMEFSSFDESFDEPETISEPSPEPSLEESDPGVDTASLQAETVVESAPITMDETLLEIFESESRTHIETLSRFCEKCGENPLACHIDKELVRALHTLHGSAEMSGVDSIAQVSTALEAMVATLNGMGKHADKPALDLISRSVDLFNGTLAAINVPGAELADWQELVAAIHDFNRTPEMAPPAEEDEAAFEAPSDAITPVDLPEETVDISSEMTASVEDVVEGQTVREDGLPEVDMALDGADEVSLLEPMFEEADTPEDDLASTQLSEIDQSLEDFNDQLPDEEDRFLSDETLEMPPELVEAEESAQISTDDISAELVEEGAVEPDSVAEIVEPVAELGAADEIATSVEAVETPPVPASGLDAPAMVQLEGDPELVEIFLEEARELQESLEGTLQANAFNIADRQVSEELQRTLHTLKGGARLAGAMPIGDLSHSFESVLSAVEHQSIPASDALVTLTHEVMDRLAEQIDDLGREPSLRSADDLVEQMDQWLKMGGPPQVETPAVSEALVEESNALPEEASAQSNDADMVESVEAVQDEPETPQEQQLPEAPSAAEPDRTTMQEMAPANDSSASLSVAADQARSLQSPVRGQREQVRVRSDLLDRLVNYAGEVSIYRTRVEQQNGQLGFNLSELEQTISRLREQLRQLEIETEAQILFRYEQEGGDDPSHDASFDPLELDRFSAMQQVSRSLMETVNDLSNINGYLEELQVETDTLLLQQSRITTDLQDGLMRTRMVPFSQIVPRLHRVVRQTCNQLDKKAELVIQGAGSEIDRGILERMIGPLEHILRNAIAHGIESPTQRIAAGKSQSGQIRLQLSREGADIQLVISDDGDGVDMSKIREQAIKSGLLDPNAEVSDADVLPFVLEHGFSTAQEVTQISGRGVGLDVVVSEVKQLGGSLDITSQAGQGANFIIRLPLTLAITDALLVELGGEIYAIPHTSVEGVVRVSLQELEACYSGQQRVYSYAGQDYQVRYLGSMLNVSEVNLSDQRRWYPLLLVRAGEHHVALQVDGLLGNRQIVVKSVGVQVATVRWISGGTILGDGRVALILDVTALVRSDVAQTAAQKPEVARVDITAPEPGVGRSIMVVDDSITVRKVTGRLLERHGMNVVTAKDGVDAVALLQEQRPDLMLLDIEMPRMDGYELARHMRNTETLKEIPIIMITSRTGEKHRKVAMELGVKRYLGKPYQEGELLDNIYAVLEETR